MGFEEKIALIFRPGRLGITSKNWKTGEVGGVQPGGQASKLGVEAGWTFLKIASRPYSESLLDKYAAGSKSYEVVFLTNKAVVSNVASTVPSIIPHEMYDGIFCDLSLRRGRFDFSQGC